MPSPKDHLAVIAESYKGIHESTQVMAQATVRMAETQQILAQTQLRMEATHRSLAWLQGLALVLVGFCLLFTGYLVWQHLAAGQEHAALMQGLIETLLRLPSLDTHPMAKLSKVDAAKAAGVSRQTLYTYLKDGRLSADAEGLIDTAELLRAGFTLHPGHETRRPDLDTAGHDLTSRLDTLDVYLDMIALLKQQLSDAQAAREREALVLQMLQDMQHRYDRLLDMPHPRPQDAPGATQTPRRAQRGPVPPLQPPADPRGAMRRRIVALLQAHPEGLTPTEMRTLLGVERSLADTCLGMLRYGLVQRVGRGRYVARDETGTRRTPA